MEHGDDGHHIHQLVQSLPTRRAQSLDHAVGRGCGQRQHQRERSHAGQNEGVFHHVLQHRAEAEVVHQPQVASEVQHGIAESKQPQHAAQPRQLSPAREFAQRRDDQGQQQKAQSPEARGPDQRLFRIGAELHTERTPHQQTQRREAQHEQKGLEPTCLQSQAA
jgi:hypothetical protein